ncbi:MAG TPA: S41 family peptidase [Gammaproteobacteria bacterium]|nr:S41 family peptidase [Gammaproteobacteria bacterium]
MNLFRGVARLPAVLAGLVLAACGGGGSGDSGLAPDPCAIPLQNQALYDTMQEYYLWYEELPAIDPGDFESPEALLEALRFRPLDRFSYITTQAEEEALFGASQFIGLGFRSSIDGTTVRTSDVFEGAPADNAGLVRGSTILAVDGVPIAEVLAAPGGFSAALGPAEIGYEVTLDFRNPDGQEFSVTIAKDVVTIPPVTAVRVFTVAGEPAGYLVLRNFVEPSIAALDTAFEELRAAGVTRLIVDLRYNGGGLIAVLEHFANLLGSRIAPGAVFAGYQFNDKNSELDESVLFRTTPLQSALDLERLVFITTPGTASASEMLINGMQPYVTTATVGRETFGKPVGQFGFLFCELVFRPVSFRTINALGEGDYFDGIPADCPAEDTLDVAFGVAGEASFDAAVHWLEQGFCPPTAQAAGPLQLQATAEHVAPDPPRWRLNDAH